jgi:hypothetical protein
MGLEAGLLLARQVTGKFEYAHNPNHDESPFANGTGRFRVSGGHAFELMPLATYRAAAAITQFLHYSYLKF